MIADPPIAVLLVDDNPANLTAAASMLEPTGYRIVSAASGTEALRCALAEDFAVILLDVHMPGLGGVETARLLRQRERSRQTPIIFVTASDEELELAREGYEAGGVDYLFKPIKDGRTLQAKVAVFAELYRTTAALRASEENFRMLADFTYDMEYWRLPDGRLVYISPSCERVTGYSQKEFLQDPNLLARIVHPEDRPAMERHFEDSGDTTAGRGYCEMEFRILTRSGEARWIGHVCQQVVGADGKSQGRRATNRDITERKNAEQIIQSMSEMLDSAPVYIAIHGFDGRLLFANHRASDMHQYQHDEFMALTIRELDTPESAALMAGRMRKVDEDGCADFEVAHLRKDRSVLPMEVFAKKVLWNGRPAILGLGTDITDRKIADATLRASEEKWRTLFNESMDGMILADPETRKFRSVNKEICQMLGYTEAELLDLSVADIHPPADLPAVVDIFQRQARGELKLAPELPMQRKDGSAFFADVTGLVIAVAGAPLLLGAFRDVTERRQAAGELARSRAQLEELVVERTKHLSDARVVAMSLMQDAQKQERQVSELLAAQNTLTANLASANKELESFSYSVSHDLRAPLRHIHGYVEMLAKAVEGQLSDKARRYLKTITDASVEMGQLIDDLLAFSRMGRTVLQETDVDLDALLRQVRQGLEIETKERNIVWKFAPLPRVLGDPGLLKQVLANLVGNAVKYSRQRDPAEIEIGCAGREDGRLIYFVKDNGAGFDMQYAHKLFGVFQRLHRAEEFEGTGIGLATVQRIIARHGGRTWADGLVDRGATFFFTLKPTAENLPAKNAENSQL